MKWLLLLPVLLAIKFANAQKTCELTFHIIVYDSTREIGDTLFIDIAQTNKKFAIDIREYDLEERFVMDSIAMKAVELTNKFGVKKALVADLSKDERYGFTTAYDIAEERMMGDHSYRVLAEKKTIYGWNCQKIELLDHSNVIGSGWMVPGFYIGYREAGSFRIREGSVIEYVMHYDWGSISLELVNYSKNIKNPLKAFSLIIPDGYQLRKPLVKD